MVDRHERHRALLLALLDRLQVRYDEVATCPEDAAIARVCGAVNTTTQEAREIGREEGERTERAAIVGYVLRAATEDEWCRSSLGEVAVEIEGGAHYYGYGVTRG